MNPEHLLQHFERISEAPDAIPRLRRFILDLAVRGKLVEQDTNDEPAAELLKRIQTEKAQLVQEGKIKAQRPLEPAESDMAAPYALPAHWEWVRFGETVNSHLGGGTPSKNNPTYWDGDIYWASVKDIGKERYVDETIDRITEAGLADSSSNLIPPGNLIVVTRMGLGKVSINRVPIAINQDLRALSLTSLAVIDYYYIFFKTYSFEGTGLTVKGVKVEELLNIAFPLPPLAEQHRIVAKVDELMALCGQLEAAKTAREQSRDRLVAASLHRLNSPDDTKETDMPARPARQADAFRDHARFVFEHLPRLTARPEHIKQLRQTILNLAVRGKLVPQDLNDEPAAELFKRIQAEKVRMVKDGKMRGPGPLQPVNNATLPFAVPKHWVWLQLREIGILSGGMTPSKNRSDYWEGEINWFSPKDIKSDELVESELKITSAGVAETGLQLYPVGCLFMVARSGILKRTFPVSISRVKATVNQDLKVLNPFIEGLERYLQIMFRGMTDFILSALVKTGTTVQSLKYEEFEIQLLPLPPLAEQHRIVARVDELMALCDQIEAQLIATEVDSRRLLEAVLHEALDPLLEVTE